MTIDTVTLAILKGRLEQIADEMDATLFRSAFNPIIAEAHDASHGIYDATTGETLVQGKSGLPIFVGVMAFAVKAVIDKAATSGGVHDGDVWIFNDPYDGGTHLSDFRLVKPVFRDGKLFCFLASVGHWHDVGGNVPGNYNPAATECFQEGMLIPPVKLYDRGEFRQDVVDILSANSRLPLSLYGDLNGQINALDLGTRRMGELLDDYGPRTVGNCLVELKARAAKLMRAQISALPQGTVSAEDWLDNDGIVDEPLKIALDLTIDGETMVMDFSRSSPACAGPVNISRSTTIAACYVALKHIFGDVPANAGVLEPVEFRIDEASLLSVRAPKPVGGYTETILRLIDVVFQAVAKIAPEPAMACAYGTINALSLAGHRENGKRWVMFSFFGGGHGAHAGGDGLNHGNAPISTATIPPLEILEAAYPVRFTQWALRPDSGGPGETRGGLGAIYEIELLEKQADVFLFGERGRHAPLGVVGGSPGAMNRFSYEQSDGWHQPPMASKMVGISIARGERLKLETPGGGGYGDPLARDPQAVARDVALGIVSRNHAEADYGVALDTEGTVDAARTETLRSREAAQ
ncbi:hydantoinase B/oxoprolinase family protein [Stappia stellulata]|uniref:hydantoinase B/oxoprolinase family protein n=1 Tax=Stappia stellulata TaxID=71235 RepID=UPI000412BDBC|nr:hydantoinase B/oxoprolinase family protein [Stappia stellulata]